MPNPIFGPNSQGKYQGAFRTTVGTVLSFAGADLNLIQNLQVSHQQPVTPLFEVGTNNRYYVVGKASGTFSATQILGFGDAALKQVTNLADPCSPRQLVLAIPSAFCEALTGVAAQGSTLGTGGAQQAGPRGSGQKLTLTLEGVLLQSVGFSVAAQDNLINSQLQGLLTDLKYDYA